MNMFLFSDQKNRSFPIFKVVQNKKIQNILQKYKKGIIGGISLEIKKNQNPSSVSENSKTSCRRSRRGTRNY